MPDKEESTLASLPQPKLPIPPHPVTDWGNDEDEVTLPGIKFPDEDE